MGRKDDALIRLPYWDRLSPEEKDLVRGSSSIQHYEKGQLIHGGAGDCLGMLLVLAGEVRTYLLSEEGREVTLFRLGEGEPCVLSAACMIDQITFETHMTAERDCDLLTVGAGAFARLTEGNIYVRCFQYEVATQRFSAVMWSMQQILFQGFDRRLAAFLVEEHERTGSVEIGMTHEQIARHTSSAREVVARMLKRFAADGLVEVGRGRLRLTDVDGLRALI